MFEATLLPLTDVEDMVAAELRQAFPGHTYAEFRTALECFEYHLHTLVAERPEVADVDCDRGWAQLADVQREAILASERWMTRVSSGPDPFSHLEVSRTVVGEFVEYRLPLER